MGLDKVEESCGGREEAAAGRSAVRPVRVERSGSSGLASSIAGIAMASAKRLKEGISGLGGSGGEPESHAGEFNYLIYVPSHFVRILLTI